MQRAQGVCPALIEETLVGGADLGTEEGVISPALGRIDVEVGGNGVVVAGEDYKGDLDQMLERRMIRLLVPYGRTLYFVDQGRERGIMLTGSRRAGFDDGERSDLLQRKWSKQLG